MRISLIHLFLPLFFCLLYPPKESRSSFITQTSENPTLYIYSAEEPVHFIIVEKKRQRLMLFEQQTSLRLLKEFTCATGENSGTKMVSGDAKTPEGVYFITEIYEDQKITVFGSRAFHLDYPNVFDTQAGRLGNGIFIHGTNKQLFPNSTNGCITLNNDDLDDLAPYLTIDKIPIIVVETLSESILDTHVRLTKHDNQFVEILRELSSSSLLQQADNIKVLYFITMGGEAIASVSYNEFDGNLIQFHNRKRAYLALAQTKDWRTLYAEQSQDNVPVILAQHPIKKETVISTAYTKIPSTVDRKKNILAFVEKWRLSWETKDIESYMNCYNLSFKSGKLNRENWKAKKTLLNQKYAFIRVTIHNIVVKWTDTGADVSFYQTYMSDKYQSSGTKMLKITNQNNRWLIQQELM